MLVLSKKILTLQYPIKSRDSLKLKDALKIDEGKILISGGI